ncbi:hypothetical protein [Actomonas aquatica]|uniref:DUF481 domain-containing protein n=1 Tax=Actomonas aquatica TaxID=2866162 RepID=A0ABZ1C7A9_9BACT|nr:hypothetical protein [Opitutus sp. WL0086]WRQ87217.1 hypothetical protein K1X11_020585 [Opitutus sp. WL0086]
MKHRSPLNWRLIVAIFLPVLLVPASRAQSATASGQATVPSLFVGELDDVGPQYLLIAQPKPHRWQLWADLEITATSNVTLVETDPATSTLTVAQVGLNRDSARHAHWGGTLGWQVGAQAQAYRYGFLAGENEKVNLVEIDRNNFALGGLHARLDWQSGPWYAAVTARASTLRANATDHTFYEELATEWALFWQKPLGAGRTLVLGGDGAMRFSATDSFGLLPHDWNNRIEQSISVLLDQTIGTRWHLRPSLRYLASHYTAAERDRFDQQVGARLAATCPLGRHAEMRLIVGFDHRESSDPLVPDFQKWDLGLAASAQWRF